MRVQPVAAPAIFAQHSTPDHPKPAKSHLVPSNKENSKVELFKSANFSLLELANRNKNLGSHVSQSSRANSSISTPRLTPLRLFERNRASDRMDLDRLEQKLVELENQISSAKLAGEEKKFEILERSIAISEQELLDNAANLLDCDEVAHVDELELLDVENSVLLEDVCPAALEVENATLAEDFLKLKQHLGGVGGGQPRGIVGELLARVERHIRNAGGDRVDAATQCTLPTVHFAAPFASDSSSDSESVSPFDALGDSPAKKRLSVVTRS